MVGKTENASLRIQHEQEIRRVFMSPGTSGRQATRQLAELVTHLFMVVVLNGLEFQVILR